MAMAAPIATTAADAAKKKVAPKAAPGGTPGGGSKGPGTPGGGGPGGGKGGGGGKPSGSGGKKGAGLGGKALKGDAGKYRRMMIAEFIVCVILLGLTPLAKGSDEMGPGRFMKRGSATCALFIILGLVSSAGKGAARAAAMFGALVTLVLLVDQREAFGKFATILAKSDADDAQAADNFNAGAGPDDSTAVDEGAGVAEA